MNNSVNRFSIIKHQFNNGLRLIIIPASGLKNIFIQICIGAGSCQEKMASRGIAHLTEHLVVGNYIYRKFRHESKNILASLEKCTASTNFDYTLFTIKIVPKKAYLTIKDALNTWLSMENFSEKRIFSAKKNIDLERKRKIHKEAAGRLYEELYKVAYRKHPYQWYTMGQKRDYLKLTVKDVLRFYRSYYAPNNIVMTVYGPVSPAKLIKCLNKQINAIKSRVLPRQNILPEPAQKRPRYRTIVSNITDNELLLVGYKIPPLGHLCRAGLTVLNFMLFRRDSEFRKLLAKKKGQIKYAFGYLPPTKYVGLFEIIFSMPRGYNAQPVKDAFFNIIGKYATGKISTNALEAAKRMALQELNQIKGKPTIFSEYLTIYETLLNNYSAFFDYQDSIRNMNKNSLILSLINITQKNHMTAVTIKPKK
ncbi:MAG: insulinase family protein [Deltaproteobacteria bacterium]|nr:insulinase family protein [Deltaproteobacteria bacterium]